MVSYFYCEVRRVSLSVRVLTRVVAIVIGFLSYYHLYVSQGFRYEHIIPFQSHSIGLVAVQFFWLPKSTVGYSRAYRQPKASQ